MRFIRGKGLSYELRHLSYIFKPHKLLIIVFTIIAAIVGGLGDSQAFFTDKNSLVPQKLTFLTNPSNARNIAIVIIVAPFLSIWYSIYRDTEEENQNISQITKKVTLPFVEEDLNKFLVSLGSKFGLSNSTRIYIMMPIRTKPGQWHLKVIMTTQNYDNREKEIRLKLNEGLIGSAFQDIHYSRTRASIAKDKGVHDILPDYKTLDQNNQALVRLDNQRYLVTAIFDKDFLSSVLIIDTNDPSDLNKLEKAELHTDIFNWIGTEPILLSLIWRLKNNGH